MKLTDHPLYVAAYVVGGLATVVGAVTLVSDLRSAGIPAGGSVITLLVGVTILALAVTGPSTDRDADGVPPDDGPGDGEGSDRRAAGEEEGP